MSPLSLIIVLSTYLITKNLDLAVGSVDGFIAAVVVAVRIYLDHQRKPLHSFLRGEVRAQAIHGDENLCDREMTLKMWCKQLLNFWKHMTTNGETEAGISPKYFNSASYLHSDNSHIYSPLLS